MNLKGAKVFVTGATGFIGSRLVQWLVDVEKAQVVAMVHNFKNASRISRHPIEMVRGDVRDIAALEAAMKGCTHVVHAAVSFAGTAEQNRATTVDGTRNVCEAARKAGIKHFVYLSTVSVYGAMPPGPVDENTPCKPTDAYGQDKLDAEAVLREADGRGLSPVILRLPVVYGPWSFWSSYPMGQFRRGRVLLPDGGGICPAIYVDDAVRAIVAGSQFAGKAGAMTCLVSGPDSVTWKRFYEEHAKASLAQPAEIRMVPKEDILAWYRFNNPGRIRQIWEMRQEARVVMRIPGARLLLGFLRQVWRVLKNRGKTNEGGRLAETDMETPNKPDVWPDPAHLELMASHSTLVCNVAADTIGFRPSVSFAEGMEKTRAWMKWARLG
jgi:nucleoside-diphosphate-sugar epimerase